MLSGNTGDISHSREFAGGKSARTYSLCSQLTKDMLLKSSVNG